VHDTATTQRIDASDTPAESSAPFALTSLSATAQRA